MNERVKELRSALGLTLEKFGDKVGVSKSAINKIEKGITNVTEQMIKSICREFDVNEQWLRTGQGDMFIDLSKDEELAMLIGRELNSEDEFTKNVILTLCKQPKEVREIIKNFMEECLKNT